MRTFLSVNVDLINSNPVFNPDRTTGQRFLIPVDAINYATIAAGGHEKPSWLVYLPYDNTLAIGGVAELKCERLEYKDTGSTSNFEEYVIVQVMKHNQKIYERDDNGKYPVFSIPYSNIRFFKENESGETEVVLKNNVGELAQTRTVFILSPDYTFDDTISLVLGDNTGGGDGPVMPSE